MDLMYMIKSRMDLLCFSQCGSVLSLALIGHPQNKWNHMKFFFQAPTAIPRKKSGANLKPRLVRGHQSCLSQLLYTIGKLMADYGERKENFCFSGLAA